MKVHSIIYQSFSVGVRFSFGFMEVAAAGGRQLKYHLPCILPESLTFH